MIDDIAHPRCSAVDCHRVAEVATPDGIRCSKCAEQLAAAMEAPDA